MSFSLAFHSGGRIWWAHLEFSRMNTGLIILENPIEDRMDSRTSWDQRLKPPMNHCHGQLVCLVAADNLRRIGPRSPQGRGEARGEDDDHQRARHRDKHHSIEPREAGQNV